MGTVTVFLSTPSVRRATHYHCHRPDRVVISIHALREEGDLMFKNSIDQSPKFLSTPSARRATMQGLNLIQGKNISIHALREEGDCPPESGKYPAGNFYPRPPRGGRRRVPAMQELHHIAFLSTPSARRATTSLPSRFKMVVISIHALREEGDQK